MKWPSFTNLCSVHPNSLTLIDKFNCPFRLEPGGVCDFIIGEISGYVIYINGKTKSGRPLSQVSVMYSDECLESDSSFIKKWGEYVYQL